LFSLFNLRAKRSKGTKGRQATAGRLGKCGTDEGTLTANRLEPRLRTKSNYFQVAEPARVSRLTSGEHGAVLKRVIA